MTKTFVNYGELRRLPSYEYWDGDWTIWEYAERALDGKLYTIYYDGNEFCWNYMNG